MIGAALKRAARAEVVDLFDVLFLLGAVACGVGLWHLWPPVALVVIGAGMMAAGWAGAGRKPSRRGR